MDESLVIDLEAARDGQGANALFNSPALGQEDEAFGEVGAFIFGLADCTVAGCLVSTPRAPRSTVLAARGLYMI